MSNQTHYNVEVKYHNSGNVTTLTYDSATERAIAMISLSAWADVVKTWES
jgi:hypothetical protein